MSIDIHYALKLRDEAKREKRAYDERLESWDAAKEKRRGMTKRHVAELRNQALGRVQACNLLLSWATKDEPHDDNIAYPLTSGGAGQDES